ncbi:intercellular adhesion molecule 1-like isoform X2 [Vombatus ursinus]|uniref:intercellular adhesion molecule 1-like isoform X2 n=1 Tax=Vombatus ursinus TaxID=29139 RepID=UPI000FFD38EE|nr:intercellular adhesion molecule 1-like isoform X2 [Vombatus ursinus]
MQVLRLLPALTAVLFLSLLLSSGAQENLIKPQVWVHPPNPVILSGSSIVMNCSTDCVNPTKIGLETRLMKILEGDGPNWKAWRLRNVTWDNSPLCYVNCPGQNQGSTRANIEVYEPPKNLELNLEPSQEQSSLPWIFVGQNITLSCHVAALAQEPPVLVTPKLLEAGTKKQVSCEMDKLFPVEKAHIQLSWGGQRLIQDITRHGDMLRATATIMAAKEEKGDRELTCNVRLGNETRNISEDLTIYTFPQPRLVVSEPIQEGYRVNLTCAADPPATVMIEGAPRDEPDRISLIVQEKDNGRLFTCQATLKLQKETLHKNSSLNLNVLFPPKLDEKCPGNWTWNEGTEQTLQCIARGNPDPTMKCVPENQQTGMPFGIPTTVIRAYSGTYRCTANNSLGVANKVVSVVVKFQDVNLRPILIGTLVSMVAVGIVISVGYVYYRQQRIRSYELKKAQEARALQPIKTEDKLCP